MPTWQHFLRVLVPRVSSLNQEFEQDENGNPNYGQEEAPKVSLLAKNMGNLDDGLSLGRPPCEAAFR
jgi:hypothetical protein